MNIPFKIFPTQGYLNSDFQVLSNVDDSMLKIFKGNELVKVAELSSDGIINLGQISDPGEYRAVLTGSIKRQFEQIFNVRDAKRFGSSSYKSTYLFDDCNFSFILMKDRMHIFDEDRANIYLENNVSPTEIRKVNDKNFLFVSRIGDQKDGITDLGVYNTDSFSFEGELLNNYQVISINEKVNKVWVQEKLTADVICFEIISDKNECFKEIRRYSKIKSIFLIEGVPHLLLCNSNDLIIIELNDLTEFRFVKNEHIALDKRGNLYQIKDGFITCNNPLSKYDQKIKIPDEDLGFRDSEFFFLGNSFDNTNSISFEAEIESIFSGKDVKVPKNDSYYSIDIDEDERIVKEDTHCQLYPSNNGLIKVIRLKKRVLSKIVFRKNNDGKWTKKPVINNRDSIQIQVINGREAKVLVKDIPSVNIVEHRFGSLIYSSYEGTFVTNGRQIEKLSSYPNIRFLCQEDKTKPLLYVESGGKTSIYDLSKLKVPLLKNVQIHNLSNYIEHGTFWFSYSNKPDLVQAFDLHTKKIKSKRIAISYVKNFGKVVYLNSQVVLNPKTSLGLGKIPEEPISTSPGFNKILTSDDGKSYNLYLAQKNQKKFKKKVFGIEKYIYKESYLSPSGKHLVLKGATDKYSFYNIETNKTENYFTGKFLEFSQEGNLIIEDENSRKARVFDPVTFTDITPDDYHYYRFLSPDGKLYAQVAKRLKYFDKVQKKFISQNEFFKITEKLNYPKITSFMSAAEKLLLNNKQVTAKQRRQDYYNQYRDELEPLGISSAEEITKHKIFKIVKFTEIGVVGSDQTVEIEFPTELSYYNYSAFSYDNRYFAYVGKPSSRGIIHIFKINYDKEKSTIKIKDSYLSFYPKFAAWVCDFSKNGYFACYDSTPDTYLIKCDTDLFSEKMTEDELKENLDTSDSSFFLKSGHWRKIHGKNFLCFSPSGKYIALSQQGYSPFSLGGYGHQESNTVHLALTETGKVKASFKEHGTKILENRNKNVVFASFSEDEKKLMTMSSDGVIIVRNLKL